MRGGDTNVLNPTHTAPTYKHVIKFNSSSLFISERLATRANNRISTICYDRNYLKEGF
jgi:hypothetical protein